jgi:hypothetical protein
MPIVKIYNVVLTHRAGATNLQIYPVHYIFKT